MFSAGTETPWSQEDNTAAGSRGENQRAFPGCLQCVPRHQCCCWKAHNPGMPGTVPTNHFLHLSRLLTCPTISNWYFTLPHNYLDKTDLHKHPVASHRKVPKDTQCSITQKQQSNSPPRKTYHELKKAQNLHRRNPLAWWRTQQRTAHLGNLFSAQKNGQRQKIHETQSLSPPIGQRSRFNCYTGTKKQWNTNQHLTCTVMAACFVIDW